MMCTLRSQVSSQPLALEWYATTLHEPSREQFNCQDKPETQLDMPNATHAHTAKNGQFSTLKPVTKRAPNGMQDPTPSTKSMHTETTHTCPNGHLSYENNQDSNFSGAVFLDIFTYPKQAKNQPTFYSPVLEKRLPNETNHSKI